MHREDNNQIKIHFLQNYHSGAELKLFSIKKKFTISRPTLNNVL